MKVGIASNTDVNIISTMLQSIAKTAALLHCGQAAVSLMLVSMLTWQPGLLLDACMAC
jgi:hypothetical protein